MPAITLTRGDITTQRVDAVVNAANNRMRGGGGVDGAIHHAGGPAVLADCVRRFPDGLATGDAGWTTAGDMPARWVIHTVGPVWHGGSKGEPELLASCYRRSLELALEHDCSSIAFPAISTGIYGYPKLEAADVAVRTIVSFIAESDRPERIVFCCFDAYAADLHRRAIAALGV